MNFEQNKLNKAIQGELQRILRNEIGITDWGA